MKIKKEHLLIFAYAGISLAYGALFIVKYRSIKGIK